MKVQAVWPGWGDTSKHAQLAESLQKHDLFLIGPPSSSIFYASDRISSLILAQTADIATPDWSGNGLKISNYSHSKKVKITDELYSRGAVLNAEDGLRFAKKLGFPVVIKAIASDSITKMVETVDEFALSFQQIRNESQSAVIIMRHLPDIRHVEVLLLGDKEGNIVTLFTRDCTIQRHNQRVITEAPAIFAMPKNFEEIERAALSLARMINFESVATVEFIFRQNESKFYFHEFSPQLHPEHPCTEMLASLNLPACQLQIAMGVPLNRIKDIRLLFGESPWDDNLIDFDKASKRNKPFGHVIAARLIAENPNDKVTTSDDIVRELKFRSSKDVWGYFNINQVESDNSDPFGYIFAWGQSRSVSRENLIMALKELSVHGDFLTSIENLICLLESGDYLMNAFNASHYSRMIRDKVKVTGKPEMLIAVMAACIHIAERKISKLFSDFQAMLERGQVHGNEGLSNVVEIELVSDGVRYKVTAVKAGDDLYSLILNNSIKDVSIHRLPDGGIFISLDGASHTTQMIDELDRYNVTVGNKNIKFYKDTHPTMLKSPCPGRLVKYLVSNGENLVKDQPYCEIEVMKTFMTLYSHQSGIVKLIKSTGEVLERGSVLGILELTHMNVPTKVDNYRGDWMMDNASQLNDTQLRKLNKMKIHLNYSLDGYCLPDPHNELHLRQIFAIFVLHLKSPKLPLNEMREVITRISNRIPLQVENDIRNLLAAYESTFDSIVTSFPTQQITAVIDDYASQLNTRRDRDAFFSTVQGMLQVVRRYRNGMRRHLKDNFVELLKKYYEVSLIFQ